MVRAAAAGMRGDQIIMAALLAMPTAVLGSGALGGIRLLAGYLTRGGGAGFLMCPTETKYYLVSEQILFTSSHNYLL